MAADTYNDPYIALQLSPDATAADIKRAFRTLSLQYHPDRPGGNAEAFIKINDAYAILSDTELRAQHDNRTSGINEENVEILMQMFQNRLFAAFAHKGRPPPIHRELWLTIQEMYDGGIFVVSTDDDDGIHINIPRGARENEAFVISGGGRSFNDVHFGDLHITVHLIPHPEFTQRGIDLVVAKRVSLKEALCGCSFIIEHPSHIPVRIDTISNPIVISPGFIKTVKGLGFNRDNIVGNLIIELNIEFPTSLDYTQRDLLRTAFELGQ
jgi:DnaJ-class molecular chaperone